MQAHRFAAMGTEVECLCQSHVPADEALFDIVEEEFRRLERIFTRFDPGSELSRLNAAGCLEVGEEMLEVTALALEAREVTDGRFDPTVHDALVSAGYDRTFAEVPAGAGGGLPPARPAGGRVALDVVASRIELGEGVRLDLGGIAKGYAVDRACDILTTRGPCLVNAGGDLAVRGLPREGVWAIAVETPVGDLTLGLDSGAMATSGSDRRRWRRDGSELHHLIDPFTGTPAETDLLRVTVAAESAVEAEVLATSLFLAGAEQAEAEANELGVPTVLVTTSGEVVAAGGLS
jgi:FAD:protein FMN transferase